MNKYGIGFFTTAVLAVLILTFAYQFSFLGIEYGNQFAFFTEFGVGYTGTIVAGGRFRF